MKIPWLYSKRKSFFQRPPRFQSVPRSQFADRAITPHYVRPLPASEAPRPQPVTDDLFQPILAEHTFRWSGSNRAAFYRYIRDHIPLISCGIWNWVHLCATPQTFSIYATDAVKKQASAALDNLQAHILENPYIRRHAVSYLMEMFFIELFTTGRFAAQIILKADGSGIDFLQTLDTDRIVWTKTDRWKADYIKDPSKPKDTVPIDPTYFFYASLLSDTVNPQGIEPLASIPFVTQIQEALVYDMAASSHNAGTPRLHIRITPPPVFPHENEKDYSARINTYFDQTVQQFSVINPADNLFTWNDIEVQVVGGEMGLNFNWRFNREQVIEDVITGLHLYPWVLGRSHGTTKNWVESQFNVLVQIVDTVQESAKALADWIRNTELKLQGIDATTVHRFSPNQDPFILGKSQAARLQYDLLDLKVHRGYISKDDAARALGLESPYKQDKP